MSNKTIAQANDEINDQQLAEVIGGATYVATATASRVPASTTTTYSASLSLNSPMVVPVDSAVLAKRFAQI